MVDTKKYEFTGETKEFCERTLHRIRARISFAIVSKGELGGWIEKKENLSQVYGNAQVSGNAEVYGDAEVSGDAWVSFGSLKAKFGFDSINYIAASLNVFPSKGIYHLFKRVKKVKDGEYVSCYDKNTKYKDGEITKADNVEESKTVSCGGGLHVSTPFYWNEGDTLIAVEVNVEDVITCQSGKLRVRKLKTICEVDG